MINTSLLQENPLKCLRAASGLGQGSVVTSYMMMGCTSTVSIAETLAQGLAEMMIGLALTQVYCPGVPVVGGIFGTEFSMQSAGWLEKGRVIDMNKFAYEAELLDGTDKVYF